MRAVGVVAFLGLICSSAAGLRGADEDLSTLIRQLEGTDTKQRTEAAESIGDLGSSAGGAVPALVKTLDAEDPALRLEVTIAIGRIGPDAASAVPALIKILETRNHQLHVRMAAIESLRRIGPPAAKPAVPVLLDLMKNAKVPGVRALSAGALARISLDEELLRPIVRELLEGLGARAESVRQDSADALIAIGRPALPGLIRRLETPSIPATLLACDVIAFLGPEAGRATPALISLLKDKHPRLRGIAARTLGDIQGGRPRVVVQQLIPLLKDEFPLVRADAARALGKFGSLAQPAVGDLVSLLTDVREETRIAAAHALGAIRPEGQSAVEGLGKALDDSAGSVTLEAADALGRIGAASVPVLVKRLESPQMRAIAAGVLADIGPEAKGAVPDLIKALKSDDAEARQEVVLALAAIGPDAKPAVADLMTLLKTDGKVSRAAAAVALSEIGAREAIPLLKQTVTDKKDPVLPLASARALLKLDGGNADSVKVAASALVAALSHEDSEVRIEAAQLLGSAGTLAAGSLPALIKATADQEVDVRLEALAAIAEMAPDSRTAVPKLIELLADPDLDIRGSAAYALGRIGPDAKSAVAPLQKLISSKDEYEQTIACYALCRIAATPEVTQKAIPLLVAALEDADSDLQVDAAIALGQIGAGSTEAKSALQKAAESKDEDLRKAASEALKKLAP